MFSVGKQPPFFPLNNSINGLVFSGWQIKCEQQQWLIKQLDVIQFAVSLPKPIPQCSAPTVSPHHTPLLTAAGLLSTFLLCNVSLPTSHMGWREEEETLLLLLSGWKLLMMMSCYCNISACQLANMLVSQRLTQITKQIRPLKQTQWGLQKSRFRR